MRHQLALGCVLALALLLSPTLVAGDPPEDRPCAMAAAQADDDCCPGMGHGHRHGQGPGPHPGQDECCAGCAERMAGDPAFRKDHDLFHFLLDHRSEITRTIKVLDDGVETVTESGNPEVVDILQQHVAGMYQRIETGNPIHQRDPLFAEIFRNAEQIEMKMKPTKKGIRVTETSKDPAVAALIQEHAKVVSLFLENGHAEMHRNHALPGETAGAAAESACPHRARMAGE